MPDLNFAAAAGLLGLAAWYGRGVARLRRGPYRVKWGTRAAAFAGGVFCVGAAQSPPLHRVADSSFAGHMAQHMVLLLAASPLLAAGAAGLPLLVALPRRLRRIAVKVAHACKMPVSRQALTAGGVHTVVLWGWHLPAPYLAAVSHPLIHAAEHVGLVAAGWLLWSRVWVWARTGTVAPAAALLLAVAMTATALGAALTFAPGALYAADATGRAVAVPDQQLAGLMMWIPMDVVYFAVALWLAGRWWTQLERRFGVSAAAAPPRPEAGVR